MKRISNNSDIFSFFSNDKNDRLRTPGSSSQHNKFPRNAIQESNFKGRSHCAACARACARTLETNRIRVAFPPENLLPSRQTETSGRPRLVRESIGTWPKNGQNTLVQCSSPPPPSAPSRTGCSQRGGSLSLTSSRHLAVTVGFDARTRCHPLDVTWTSVHANCRESTPMETSGNEPIDRFGASVLEQGGYVSIFNARIGKGFGWSIGDRTGQG